MNRRGGRCRNIIENRGIARHRRHRAGSEVQSHHGGAEKTKRQYPKKMSGQIINEQIMKHDLVDGFWRKIFPITLGGGKRLVADGTIPAAFKVTERTVTSKGVTTSELRACRRSPNRKYINIQPGGARSLCCARFRLKVRLGLRAFEVKSHPHTSGSGAISR
jgi:hypothetical protein